MEYLSDLHRTELRMMAKQQGLKNSAHMDRLELIVALLDVKIAKAERFVVTQARAWSQHPDSQARVDLQSAVVELESLHEARNLWLKLTTKD